MKKLFQLGSALGLAFALAACGGGGGSSNGSSSNNSQSSQGNPQQQPTHAPTANTVPVTIDSTGIAFNSPRVSVTVCQSGTSNCATIPNVIVDTGSVGLRLFKSALPATLALTPEVTATNHPIGECEVFGGGPAWGQVVTADLQMAGERANALPVQLMDATFASAPSACTNQGVLVTAQFQMANGILGVANSTQDSGTYYDCTSFACNPANGMSATLRVVNPVSKFASDNNGIVLSFPNLATGMAASAVGSLTFGVNTQANNADGNVSMEVGISNGMTTSSNGKSILAIIDSGSGVDYLDTASMPTCLVQGYTGYTWYCPSSTMSFSAAFTGGTGNALNLTYAIANAQAVFTTPVVSPSYAIANLALQEDLFGQPEVDLGMSYLYGHTLFLQYPDSSGVSKIGVANI